MRTTTEPDRTWLRAAAMGVALIAVFAFAGMRFEGTAGSHVRAQDSSQLASARTQLTSGQAAATTDSTPVPVRFVQANIKSGMELTKVRADLAKVYAMAPDFVTFNEVAYRSDALLAPPGYQLFRTPGQYTGSTPVAWNTAKWTSVATGTYMISDSLAKDSTQNSYWGLRYANWVTLMNATGHVVSVISVHVAPETKTTMGLLEPSVRRLGALATALNAQGPVIMGGDFNVGYNDATRYPRATLTAYGITPTYDVLGTSFPTGDHYGATIDYVMLRSAAQFQVVRHWPTELESDHDAVTADLVLNGQQPGGFVPGVVRSRPGPTRSVVMSTVIRAINAAPSGAAIHLASRSLGGSSLRLALERAHQRGVHVQVLTGEKPRSRVTSKLAAILGTNLQHTSWARAGAASRMRGRLPVATVLISISDGTPAVRIDVNRPLVPKSKRQRMRAVVRTTKTAYDKAFYNFFAAAGRTL